MLVIPTPVFPSWKSRELQAELESTYTERRSEKTFTRLRRPEDKYSMYIERMQFKPLAKQGLQDLVP